MRLNGGTLAAFALLAAGGPFAIDMYLPAFPAIAADLNTTPSLVQLTLSTFMVGMALGQLFVGALSDTRGRHRLLVIGAVVSVAASASCALTTHINLLIAARFILGLGSGACVVLARACVSDLAHGRSAARAFSIMMTIQGLAPVIAPILGGLLAEPIRARCAAARGRRAGCPRNLARRIADIRWAEGILRQPCCRTSQPPLRGLSPGLFLWIRRAVRLHLCLAFYHSRATRAPSRGVLRGVRP